MVTRILILLFESTDGVRERERRRNDTKTVLDFEINRLDRTIRCDDGERLNRKEEEKRDWFN